MFKVKSGVKYEIDRSYTSNSEGDRRDDVAGALSHMTPLVYGGGRQTLPAMAAGNWKL